MRSRVLALLLAALLMLALSNVGISAPAAQRPTPRARVVGDVFAPDEVLVKFRADVDPAVFARSIGARAESRIAALDVHVLKIRAGAVEAVVRALSNHPLVEYAEPNGIAWAILDPNDPYDNTTCFNSTYHGCVTQWAWAKVKAYDAWSVVTGGAVKVAVVDTGFTVGPGVHEDMPTTWAAFWDFANNFGDTPYDDNGHGTHVTGTIGALMNNGIGVTGASSVNLIGAKVLDASGSGYYSWVANGIRWSADQGAKVINLSLGGSIPSKTLENAVKYAWNKGAVIACAAGNGNSTQKTYPAAYTNCIAAGATDENDAKASFSSYGVNWVDVAAPGERILSTLPPCEVLTWLTLFYGYGCLYDALRGTSMSAPHVAGLAALVWARYGLGNTPAFVRGRIETTADSPGAGVYWKWGRVNYCKAVGGSCPP